MAFSKKVRKQILHDANYKCQGCGCDVVEILEASHVIKHADNPDAIEKTHGIALCANCHKKLDRGIKIEFQSDKDEKIRKWKESGEWFELGSEKKCLNY